MTCASNQLGDKFSYCLPGSLVPCAPGGSTCPPGEACALALDGLATAPASAASAYVGRCLAQLIAADARPAGSTCATENPYSCEDEGGYLGVGCFQRRCARACASDQECAVGMVCGPAPYSSTLGGVPVPAAASARSGVCQGRQCGQVHGEAGALVGQVNQQGADASCPAGEICAVGQAVGAAGDTALLSCVPPLADSQPFGAPCSRDPAQHRRCADDSLCVTRAGAGPSCSQLCRTDKDCPTDNICLDGYPSAALPNGSISFLSMCAPRASIATPSCRGEHDCPAGTACAPVGRHSALLTCQATAGTKNVGETCAAPGECRSAECADRDGNLPGANNRASCAGYCGRNSDCAPGQLCLRRVVGNNGTIDDPRDDLVLGFCTTLDAPALEGGCTTDDNCTGQTAIDEIGGDTCDTVHQTCYSKLARIGDACAHRADCPLGAYCHLLDPNFEGGVCLSLGCDPAASLGVDACGAGAVCVQRSIDAPLFGCYDACGAGNPCRRAAERYFCQPAVSGAPGVTICVTPGGS